MNQNLPVEFPATINSHKVDSFRKCPQHWAYEHVFRLGPTDVNHDLFTGGCYSTAMEALRQEFASTHDVNHSLQTAAWKLFETWGDHNPPPTNKKTLPAMVEALYEYDRCWPLDEDPIQPVHITDSPAVEVRLNEFLPFDNPDTGEQIIYNIRLDMYGQYKASRIYGPLDDKTTSAMGQGWVDQWKLSGQMIGYQWVLEQNNLPVEMIWIRGIAIQARGFTSASVEMPKFPKWQVKAWYRTLLHTLDAMITQYKRGYYDRAYSWSCKGCVFAPLCTSSRPEQYMNNYRVRQHTTMEDMK